MNRADPSPHIGAVLVWLLVQLAALGLSAARVPLAARWPADGEALALEQMLVAQTVAAGMLFPALLRDPRSCAVAILTSLPFVQLAALLSSTTFAHAAPAAGLALLWLVTLCAWRAAWSRMTTTPAPTRPPTITPRAELLGVAVANALTIGGALAWFAAADAGAPSASRAAHAVATVV